MTFCVGMKCADGLVAIADTRITTGAEVSTAKKIAVHQGHNYAMFVLTSGLRSVRDKAITYFEDRLRETEANLGRMYRAVNLLAEEIRNVYTEDQTWLSQAGFTFDLHCIVGGQLPEDDEHHLYLLYPQGNWVEVSLGSPYVIIGETRYGKPILDRAWRHTDTLEKAFRVGLLSFDATRTSSSDVGPPVDAVVYRRESFAMTERRFSADELQPVTDYWQTAMQAAVDLAIPSVAPLAGQLGVEPAPPPPGVMLQQAEGNP